MDDDGGVFSRRNLHGSVVFRVSVLWCMMLLLAPWPLASHSGSQFVARLSFYSLVFVRLGCGFRTCALVHIFIDNWLWTKNFLVIFLHSVIMAKKKSIFNSYLNETWSHTLCIHNHNAENSIILLVQQLQLCTAHPCSSPEQPMHDCWIDVQRSLYWALNLWSVAST